MKETGNFGLNQWEMNDRIQMEDFNRDNRKIDEALHENGQILAEHAAALARLGNCKIYTTSYRGTGKNGAENPNTLTFPEPPLLVLISSSYAAGLVGQSNNLWILFQTTNHSCKVTRSEDGKTISWYSNGSAHDQLNDGSYTFYVTALTAAAE